MSLDPRQILEGLAMGQFAMVAPELGDGYAGKSAGVIAMLMLAVATMQDRMLDKAPALCARLVALLGEAAPMAGPVKGEIESALVRAPEEGWFAYRDRLMGALEALHGWADLHDPTLAVRCRDYLADHALAECVELPMMAG